MGGYTILRTLAILDDTGAHLPLSSTLLFVGLDCQQLSHGVNFTCQFLMLDLSPSVRRESKILANPCNPSWLTLASDKWSSVFSVVISLVYWMLLLPAQILFKAKALTNGSPPSDAMTGILFYISLKLDSALHVASAISLTLDFLFESKYDYKAIYLLAPLFSLFYAVGYSWWVERCGAMNGR